MECLKSYGVVQPDEKAEADPDELLRPCLVVVLMIWSWGLWFSQRVLGRHVGVDPLEVRQTQSLGDLSVAPLPKPGMPVFSHVLDKATIIACDEKDAKPALMALEARICVSRRRCWRAPDVRLCRQATGPFFTRRFRYIFVTENTFCSNTFFITFSVAHPKIL